MEYSSHMKHSLGPRTLAMPAPVWLVATYDAQGRPNFMTIAWGGICSSQPPCVTVSLRSATYSHSAILARRAYTVNIASSSLVAQADYAGMVSGRDRDKFADCQFTAVRSAIVDAPFIDEVALVLECRLVQTLDVGIHTMFVGEIMDVKADESILMNERTLDIARVSPIIYDTARRAYRGIGPEVGPGWEIGKTISRQAAKLSSEKIE